MKGGNSVFTVIGIEQIVSKKDGKRFVRLHCTKEFGANQINVDGLAVESLFFASDDAFVLGDIVKPIYEKSYNDKAILVGVDLIKD